MAVEKRWRVFERRAGLYRQIDTRLRSHTRFFAAAALINTVFAQLFRYAPDQSLEDAYVILDEAGALLEVANLRWVRVLCECNQVPSDMDRILVCGEQRLLQSFLDTARGTDDWSRIPITDDLNRLLNHRNWTLLRAPCLDHSRRFLRVLDSVRAALGHCFDFNLESHRVRLGLGIVCEIRRHGR